VPSGFASRTTPDLLLWHGGVDGMTPSTHDVSAPLLFLDFDGVLHPLRSGEAGRFVCMPAFEAWARAHPAIEIVISSTRRQIFPFETIRRFFSSDIRGRIIGVTPIVVVEAEYKRHREIGIWLHKNQRDAAPWLALDDSEDRFPPGCPNLVLCDPARGFDEETAERLTHAFAALR
jgi:hypothetical protein